MQLRPPKRAPTVMHWKIHHIYYYGHNEMFDVSLILVSNHKRILGNYILHEAQYKKRKSNKTLKNWDEGWKLLYGGICSCTFCLRIQQKLTGCQFPHCWRASAVSGSKEQAAFVFSQSLSYIIGWLCSELLYPMRHDISPRLKTTTLPQWSWENKDRFGFLFTLSSTLGPYLKTA